MLRTGKICVEAEELQKVSVQLSVCSRLNPIIQHLLAHSVLVLRIDS